MEKTMGIFYNKTFDTLMLTFLGDDIIWTDKQQKTNDIIFVEKEARLGATINILNASAKFNNLYEGINSDNELLLTQLKLFLNQQAKININEFNLNPQFVIGKIEKVEKHADSDKLNICQVNLLKHTFQIVCGANNVKENQKVVVATIGAFMPNGVKINPTKLRSVDSNGMICSAKELGIDLENEVGIMVLQNDKYAVGTSFWKSWYNE